MTETFEEARVTWRRKIEQFANKSVPYMEVDDVRQEMELVLYKCIDKFDPTRSTKFHTYLHTAMENQIRKLWGPYSSKDRVPRGVHPNYLLYLGGLERMDDAMSDNRIDRMLVEKLTSTLEPSLAFHMTDLGFEGHEQTWLAGRCEGLSIGEIAEMQGLPEEVVREGYVKAKRRIRGIRRRGNDDNDQKTGP